MFSNLISSEPTAFLIAFLSLGVLALYLFIRSQTVAARMKHVATQCEQLQTELNSERIASAKLHAQNEAHQARIQALHTAHEDKLAAMNASEQRLHTQFENLANRIFEEKQQRYTQQTKHNIEAVLAPFKNELDGFKRQISEQHIREGQERASLKTEILSLKALNQKITEEAAALTNALKGDNKKQGNWGEVVLERILKESGLREGHEFETQMSATSEQGKRFQPDVVVHLPNDKDVIIDSKVSLAAYERYFNCEDDTEKAQHLAQHVASIKGHIKGLGAKDYQTLQGIKTLDYVLLFIPIEPAFAIASANEPNLYEIAFDKQVIIVTPSTLLAALRLVDNLWQNDRQKQNAIEIATQAGALYDSFTNLTDELIKVGKQIGTVQNSYEGAMKKLTGRGNLIKRVEKLKKLGAKASKAIDAKLLSRAEDSDED